MTRMQQQQPTQPIMQPKNRKQYIPKQNHFKQAIPKQIINIKSKPSKSTKTSISKQHKPNSI